MAKPKRICSVPDCGKFCHGNGFCANHYNRFRRYGTPLGGSVSSGIKLAWIRAHVGYDGDDCLKWPFSLPKGRYDRAKQDVIAVGGRKIVASRFMCILAKGVPPDAGYQAAHSCGKSHLGCINPKHLSWKTPAENTADMWGHGTMHYGQTSYLSKLTNDDVRIIRNELSKGVFHRILAVRFGVTASAIGRIATGKNWSKVV